MRTDFSFQELRTNDYKMYIGFCKYIVSNIRRDIRNYAIAERLKSKESYLLNSGIISWTEKPEHIDFIKLLRVIARNIIGEIRIDKSCSIHIKDDVLLPRSATSLSKVVRFLDKGNLEEVGTYFLSRIFLKYKRNIQSYWEDYVSYKTRLNGVLTIR